MSRSIAGDLIDQGDNATGYLGFAYGVIDAMSQRSGLSIPDTKEVLTRYLSRVWNGDMRKVEDTLAAIALIPTNKVWAHSIGTGGTAALEFLQSSGRNTSASFALFNMLQETSVHP